MRAFELLLLREIGLLPSLDLQTLTLAPLEPDARYSLVPEAGLVAARDAEARGSLSGAQWQACSGRWTTRRLSTPPCSKRPT